MSSSRISVVAIPALLVLGLLLCIGSYIATPKLAPEQAKWLQTTGFIADAWWEYDGVRRNECKPHTPDYTGQDELVRIDYVVDSKPYSVQLNRMGSINDPVVMRYNPENPQSAVVEPDLNVGMLTNIGIGYIAGSLLIVIGLIGALYKRIKGFAPEVLVENEEPKAE